MITLCCIGLFFLSPIYAQDEKKTVSNQATKAQKSKAQKSKVQKQQKKKFVPSEQIDADTSVSFPVDI